MTQHTSRLGKGYSTKKMKASTVTRPQPNWDGLGWVRPQSEGKVAYNSFKTVMTFPSLGTAIPIPLSLSPTHRLLWSEWGRKFLEEIISSWPQYRDRVKFHREQRNFLHLTELENRTTFMFWRRYKRSVKNPATNLSVWYNYVKLMGDNTATLP